MDKLEEIIRTNPTISRLVVTYKKGGDGKDHFQWGICGAIPVAHLIGYIVRIQSDLMFRSPEHCQASALAILYKEIEAPDGVKLACNHSMTYFVNRDIPVDPLLGMLETVKAALVGSRVGQSAVAQRVQVLGPDGTTMR